ncbi:CoA-binding protein [Helicobacter sp. faydin-H20]|uniref:CoA-binding protein n=1 Tax=Helicobacter anatolicus TaxID=2905874 RepID=UPI001E4D58C4|nr:CoA-binding protein [Helicobacter anatolicus]MCE3036426.1 CoA-binding protein [Helicobacter anatolicus]
MQKIFDVIKNIAIIGLSQNPTKDSYQVALYLQNQGLNIIPIYPKEDFILHKKVYRTYTQAIQETPIDCVVIFRKSEACLNITKEIVQCSLLPKVIWLQLEIINQDAKKLAESKNIIFIQNQCIKIQHQKLYYNVD